MMIQNQFQNDIQQANELLQAEKINNAYRAYRACLTRASAEQLTISVGQLSAVWMGIGFCYAARTRWERALRWYHLSKTAVLSATPLTPDPESPIGISRRAKWEQYAPDGATTTYEHDAPARALGEICEAIALAYENSDQDARAVLYHEQAANLYERAGQAKAKPSTETAVETILFPDLDPYDLSPVPIGSIGRASDALTILQHYGVRHFGATERQWNVVDEAEFEFFTHENEKAERILGVTLHLPGEPEQAINVSFTLFACRALLVEKRPFADHDHPVFVTIMDKTLTPHVDTLYDWLEGLNFSSSRISA